MSQLARSYVVVDDISAKKASSNKTHDIYYCPYCLQKEIDSGVPDPKPDTHGKLYIHKEKKVGLCFRCNTVVFPAKKVEDAFDTLCESLCDSKEFDLSASSLPRVNLSHYSDAADSPTAMQWLKKRNKYFSESYIRAAKFKFYNQELVDDNGNSYFKQGVIAPMIWNGEIKSYQVRFFTDNHAKRFHTNNGIRLLYLPLPITPYSEITLCEGVYDAHALLMMGFPNVVAILGKTLSAFQLMQLRELLPHTVNFCLDDYICNGDISRGLKRKVPTIEDYRFFSFPDFSTREALDPEEFLMLYGDFDYYNKQLKFKRR